MARKKREQLEIGAAEAGSAIVAVSDAPADAAPVEVEAPPVVRWRVAVAKRVSLFGHMTNLSAGDVVALNEYGREGIERLREQNVVLEPMV